MGLGFILVVRGAAVGATQLADLRDVKIGVPMSTPVDGYLFDNGYDRELYLGNRRVMKGIAEGEVDAALVWSPNLAVAKQEFPDVDFGVVPGYVPEADLRWNVAMVLPKDRSDLKRFVDDSIDEMVANGEVKRIVEKYGAPYFPPFE
jgi:ABC-type amino acid transport substrate-binding protein|tara:strand:- start:268 stop:708 length:441 start_codon:yes stop_codon:yes gene_type:complete